MKDRTRGKLTSREYISRLGIGSAEECGLLKIRISRWLNAWYSEKAVAGYAVVTLSSEVDVIDEDLVDFEVTKLTDGLLPVIWMNVTFQSPQFSQFERSAFESEFDLLLVCETESLD